MAFQPALDCAEIVINASGGGKAMANVLNVHYPGSYTQADLDNLSSAVDNIVGADYIPLMGSNLFYDNTTVRGLSAPVDLISINNTSAGAGAASGAPMPNNTTLCFRLQTGFTGRSARGRFYAFPTGLSNFSLANVYGATYADAIVSMLQSIQAACVTNGCTLVILNRVSGGFPLVTPVARAVTTIDYRNLDLDSQRGRLVQGH